MSEIELHRKLLGDAGRNQAFHAALKQVITPGVTTVADLGAGTGFLSFLARRLGAKHCHLIEYSEALGLAQTLARANGITRSANRALVNIAVRQGEPGADRAVAAKVTVAATNLAGQRVELRMREVREGDAIYYLGEARTSGRETLSFDLSVTPEGAERPIRTVFRQEFFGQ